MNSLALRGFNTVDRVFFPVNTSPGEAVAYKYKKCVQFYNKIWIEGKYTAIFVKVDLFLFVRLDGMLVDSKISKM